MIENGIYHDMDHATYHAITDRVSNSYLSRLNICPAAAKVPQEETAAMTFGRAFHSFILDGMQAFCRDVAIEPEVNKRTNAGKDEIAAFREQNKGRAVIAAEGLQTITSMDASVKAHPMACKLIGAGANEVSIFWDDPVSNLPCKARPDKVAYQSVLIDLKKTRDASQRGFLHSILQYGYHRQAAFYLDGMRQLAPAEDWSVFAFIAVEDAPPYRVEVYTLSPDFIDYGRQEYQRLIDIEVSCRASGLWPNYNTGEVTEIDLPRYLAA